MQGNVFGSVYILLFQVRVNLLSKYLHWFLVHLMVGHLPTFESISESTANPPYAVSLYSIQLLRELLRSIRKDPLLPGIVEPLQP